MNNPTCTGGPGEKKHPRRTMHKAGKRWSGQNRVQAFKCQSCGRLTIKSK